MEIKSLEDLIEAGLAESSAQRLLIVLLKAEAESDSRNGPGKDVVSGQGTLTPVMAADVPLTPDMDLSSLLSEADQLGHPWDLIMVSSLSTPEGRMPTEDEAEPYLSEMANAVMTGSDLSSYAVFDRGGSPVRLAATQTLQ